MNSLKSLGLSLLVVMGSSPTRLQAGDTDPLQWGAQAYAAFPVSTLTTLTSRPGLGFSLFHESKVTGSTLLQVRLDHMQFHQEANRTLQNSLPSLPATLQTLSAQSSSLGIEVRQYLPLTTFKQVYLLAGLSAVRYEFKYTPLEPASPSQTDPSQGVASATSLIAAKLGVSCGLGFDCTESWGSSIRYLTSSFSGRTVSTVQAGITYRF